MTTTKDGTNKLMIKMRKARLMIVRTLLVTAFGALLMNAGAQDSFTNAAFFGFSPGASGTENAAALQKAVDQTGTIIVSRPGIYKVAGTVYIGSNTTLDFGNGVILQKVNETGAFSQVLLNKGALTKTYDDHIIIKGLHLSVNGVDTVFDKIFGLRGQVAFFYVRDLKIEDFRCDDIATAQFGIQVCTFQNLLIDDVILKGNKDGIHLGHGNRFTISNAVFETLDDAIALNADDYATSNPELGWIENGLIRNCYDLNGNQRLVGFFCRISGGGWMNWKKGMEVRNSDAVVSNGRIYRVYAKPDGKAYTSLTQPVHAEGIKEEDGIRWVMMQVGEERVAGVRNVTFRDICLEKPRPSFSLHFDNDKYSRSYYPGAEVPVQQQFVFDDIRILHDGNGNFLGIDTPVDAITICNSSLKNGGISFHNNKTIKGYPPTRINIYGTVFNCDGTMELLKNDVPGKLIYLNTSDNIATTDKFSASVDAGKGKIILNADLPGLQDKTTQAKLNREKW